MFGVSKFLLKIKVEGRILDIYQQRGAYPKKGAVEPSLVSLVLSIPWRDTASDLINGGW